MIRLLRNTRKRQIQEKNVWGYLLYATGEVLLVVIGILIALQVDNWNDERLGRKEALVLYRNTKQQLLEDRQNMVGQVAFNNLLAEQFEHAVLLIERDERYASDSLMAVANRLVEYSDFDREKTIYETLVNSGNMKLLKNEAFKKGLRGLEETYRYVNRMESIHYDAIMQMVPYMSGTLNIAYRRIANEDALYSMRFQNMFAISLRLMGEKDMVYQRALDEIDALTELIGEELEKDND